MSARQCLKRLHLEVQRPELARVPAAMQAAFRTGHEVGDVARQIYGDADAVLIPYAGGLAHALRKTARIVADGPRHAVFEATFQHRGVLVRTDLLLPDGDNWRLVEVKASTSVKDEHAFDCAIQYWVMQGLGHTPSSVHIAHVDNGYVYGGDGDYQGLLSEVDMQDAVAALLPAIPEWIDRASSAMGVSAPQVAVGGHCNQPYECPFMHHCWPSDTDFPVQQLPRASKAKLAQFIAAGYTDLRDVPADRLSENQRRVQAVAIAGRAELLPGAAECLHQLGYPRYYLDFETVSPAVPLWAGTRPYEVLPFQWSCHYEAEPGRLEHADFLDLSGQPPMRRFAKSLIAALGTAGPVFVYTGYEERVLQGLCERFTELSAALAKIIDRLTDLEPLTRQNFYAPSMAGSWSLKAVMPAISTELDYSKLEGIQEGTAASEGYLEAIDTTTTVARRRELKQQLLRYCELDTLGLARLAHFLGERHQR
jgi:hypothetical protein